MWPKVLLLLCTVRLLAQTEAAPAFEAASVKRLMPGATGVPSLGGGPGTSSPGQLRGAATLKTLLMRAYDVKNFQIDGPAWMDSERYEVNATVAAGSDAAAVAAMLRSLLAERFHLSVRRVKRRGTIVALVVAKKGPKMKEANEPQDVGGEPKPVAPKLVKGPDGLPQILPGSEPARTYEIVMSGSDGVLFKLWGYRETMARFADYLSARLNREVVDRTGLRGRYHFQLAWSMERAGGAVPRTGPPPDQIESYGTPILSEMGQSIFSALPSQLGLRLEARRGAIDVLVVDRVEMSPTEN